MTFPQPSHFTTSDPISTLGFVLVADDDPAFRDSTCDILRQAGYQVDGVSDAGAAQAKLAEKRYDLLISDIRMPGSNNLDYLEAGGAAPDRIPVIVLTGYPSVETAAKTLRLPVMSYLVKPFDVEPFLAEVQRAVSLRRVQTAIQRAAENARAAEKDFNAATALLAGNPREAASPQTILHLQQLLFDDARQALGSLEDFSLASLSAGTIPINPTAQFRPLALVEALREVVVVLEKTKSSFKSRELGDLRRRIESLLRPSPSPPATTESTRIDALGLAVELNG